MRPARFVVGCYFDQRLPFAQLEGWFPDTKQERRWRQITVLGSNHTDRTLMDELEQQIRSLRADAVLLELNLDKAAIIEPYVSWTDVDQRPLLPPALQRLRHAFFRRVALPLGLRFRGYDFASSWRAAERQGAVVMFGDLPPSRALRGRPEALESLRPEEKRELRDVLKRTSRQQLADYRMDAPLYPLTLDIARLQRKFFDDHCPLFAQHTRNREEHMAGALVARSTSAATVAVVGALHVLAVADLLRARMIDCDAAPSSQTATVVQSPS